MKKSKMNIFRWGFVHVQMPYHMYKHREILLDFMWSRKSHKKINNNIKTDTNKLTKAQSGLSHFSVHESNLVTLHRIKL